MRLIFSHNMLRTLVTFCCLFAVPTMAYRTPLRSTASSKTKIFESGFGEALSSVLSLVPSLLPIAGQIYLVNLLTQSRTKDITAVQVESKSDLKAVLGELKSEIKAVQETSIHRAELNSGEMKVLLATVTRLASLVENADARNLRDL